MGHWDFSLTVGAIIQLNAQFECIERLQKFVYNNYEQNVTDIFNSLEDEEITLFKIPEKSSIREVLPDVYMEIITMLKSDESVREIFSLTSSNQQYFLIAISDDPSFAYFKSILKDEFYHLATIQWTHLSKDEKEPYIDAANIIKKDMVMNLNKLWKSEIQNFLYLILHNEFRDSYLLY